MPLVSPQRGQGRPNTRMEAQVRNGAGMMLPRRSRRNGSARQYTMKPSTARFVDR